MMTKPSDVKKQAFSKVGIGKSGRSGGEGSRRSTRRNTDVL